MTHSFLILAHDEPKLLLKLVNTLMSDNHLFYIHIDKRSKQVLESDELSELSNESNVTVVSRYNVNWGGFNMIRATLLLMELAQKDNVDWVHLISGHDFPIRSNKQIDSFFDMSSARGYFSFVPESQYSIIEENRMNIYHFNDVFNMKRKKIFTRLINKLFCYSQRKLRDLGLQLRKPIGIKLYKGANWFSANKDIIAYIIEYCREHPEYIKRYKYTSCCDEVFFHTILMQSPFVAQIVRDDLRYIKWIEGASSPEWLTETDYDEIVASNDIFCRKVCLLRSSVLLEKLIHYK